MTSEWHCHIQRHLQEPDQREQGMWSTACTWGNSWDLLLGADVQFPLGSKPLKCNTHILHLEKGWMGAFLSGNSQLTLSCQELNRDPPRDAPGNPELQPHKGSSRQQFPLLPVPIRNGVVLLHRLRAEPQPDSQPCVCYSASCPACSSSMLFPPAGLWKCLWGAEHAPPAPSLVFSGFLIQLLQSWHCQWSPSPAPVIPANRNSLRASRFGCWLSRWIFQLLKSKGLLVEAFKNK